MTIGEFLRKNLISLGDNCRVLLEKLELYDERIIKELESTIGEPAKMSKSKGNTVDPEDMVQKYGADTVRLYVLFAGPVEKDFEWTEEGIAGAYRFIRRLWNTFHQYLPHIKDIDKNLIGDIRGEAKKLRQKTHQTLQKYIKDMESLSFNTAIAGIMELLNHLQDFKPETPEDLAVVREAFEMLLFMLYPITPHVAEELWHRLGYTTLMIQHPFPEPDKTALQEGEVSLAVQINGKVRATVVVPKDADEEMVRKIVLSDEKVRGYLDGREVKRFVYVKNKLVNLVV
ncbi:tRNA synthetase valyl/leucyl anticodon-binding protein [Thermocrinis albus DSM 14484]|uniref:leucine--tRNA ligase n=1 Tax=Thermocrinis albus (strain DSM 14484 / JCM 11386 / HI 11/12) TaxID=638303 RepID=D3SQ65_THEAH|nr:class I tRNA ligase family protein [Thermocrinis albus]ADC89302.1 tRNA synthetase valyl/leucyl anticodon-binding protein [Thermocrinis albus DSM 14484]